MVTSIGAIMVSVVTGHLSWVMGTTLFIGHWPIGLKSIDNRDIYLLNANLYQHQKEIVILDNSYGK